MKKNEINSNGLSSKYLRYLSKKCLSKPAPILPCDHFFMLRTLPTNSSYIINLDNSQYSGSHYVAVIVKKEYVWYFDSIGLPPGLSMSLTYLTDLKELEKTYYGAKNQFKVSILYSAVFIV